MSEVLANFRGAVRCERFAPPPELILGGSTLEAPGEETTLAFSAPAPAELPDTLADAVVERLPDGRWRITSATRSWLIGSGPVHLHREVAATFYRALPPRPVPWRRRLFLRVVLGLAASRAGLALLKALRR